jgi:hypothetical protein
VACLLLLEWACLAGHDPSPFLQGLGRWRGRESLARRAAKTEGGVMADPSLGVRPILLGSVGLRSFGPSLVDVLWAARPAN